MATQEYRIAMADKSEIHIEAHIWGSRPTVQFVHELVEEVNVKPERVAERYNVDIADIYGIRTCYHSKTTEIGR